MTVRSYRGDAPAVAKVVYLPRPEGITSGRYNIHINNKTIFVESYDVDDIIEAWNSSDYPETQNITASASSTLTETEGQYGVIVEPDGVILTSDVPGEDFFVTVSLGDGSSLITNEIQYLTFDPIPTGGTFTLIFSGQTTAAITFVSGNPSTTAANILAALEALSNIAPGDVVVSYVSDNVFSVSFEGTYQETNLPLMTCAYTSLTGGDVSVVVTVIQEGELPTDEVQTLSLASSPTGGTFTLTYDGQTTGNIAYDASAGTVQTALEALSNIAPGDVVCSGGALPTTPVVITFAGNLAGTNVPLITGDGTNLTGTSGNITGITTVRQGSIPTNFKGRYYYNVSPTGKYAYWANNPSVTFASNASLATIKAALVGSQIDLPVGYNYGNPTQSYTILTTDVDITGDLSVQGASGGIIVELKGNLAGLSGLGDFVLDLQSTTGVTVGASQEILLSVVQAAVPTFEIQQYTITDYTITGTYTLTVYDTSATPHTTDPIAYDASGTEIAAAINAALGGNYVAVNLGYPSGNSYTPTLQYSNLGYQGTNITVLSANEGSVQVVTTTDGDPGTPEIQNIVMSGSEDIRGGTYTITYDGETTSSLAYNVASSGVQIALEALTNLDAGEVAVSGGFTGSQVNLRVTFDASLGNVTTLTGSSVALNNAKLEVSEFLAGGLAAEVQEVIRNKGPECFDDSLNYDPQGLPSDGDILLFEFGQAACRWGTKQRDTFTVDASTDLVTLSTNRPIFQDGQKIRLRTTGVAPAGLTANSAYYVVNSDTKGNLQLSSTLGGTAINITDAGTGVHTLELTLDTFRKSAKYNFDIGLPRNNTGFEEYRPRYLEAAITNLILGEGEGSDSALERYDLGTTQSSITIYNTGSGSEPDTPACGILIVNDATDILAYGGEVGIPCWLDEECTIHDFKGFDVSIKAIGGLTMNNLTLDKDCSLIGEIVVQGTAKIGL